jgi:2-polyprenyl-3-methyl-5-hydroxy-6-metoxy-1,4-benzoquinol methylase
VGKVVEVIENVGSEEFVLAEVHGVLRRDGWLFLTTPNRFYPFETHGFQIGR